MPPSRRLAVAAVLVVTVVTATACGSSEKPAADGHADPDMALASRPDLPENAALDDLARSTTAACGVQRWSVKTGTDAAARQVDVRHPRPTSIAALDTAPPSDQPQGRQPGIESTAWSVTATLLRYKVENDGDVHAVLADADGHTLIVEFPDPGCVGRNSAWRVAEAGARRSFDSRYSAGRRMRRTHKKVTVVGVGFFDAIHGQSGVAPNGVELHPVLSIRF